MGVMSVALPGPFRIFLGLWLWRVIASAAALLWSCRPFARCGAHHRFLLIAGPTANTQAFETCYPAMSARMTADLRAVIDAG